MYPLTVVQQEEGDYRIDVIIRSLSENGMSVVVNFEEFQSTIASRMRTVEQDGKRPAHVGGFNFLFFSDVDGVDVILSQAQRLDRHYGWGSLLRHMSKWLIVLTDGGDAGDLMLDNILLDNVAITSIGNLGGNYTEEKITSSVYTLMWEKDSRELQQVSQTPTEDAITRVFPNTGHGLNGRVLRAAALNWVTCEKKFINDTFTYLGFCDHLLSHLSRTFNFSYTYVEPADQSWGVRHPNGTWDGIIRMLIDGNADISPVPYALSYERSMDLTFSHPVDFRHSDIIYKKPVHGVKWGVLLLCFQWQIYALGFAVMVWVAIAFQTLKQASEWLFPQRDMKTDNLFVSKTALILGVPLKQGSPVLPPADSHRVLFSFWWIFCILVTSVYSGNLIAYLAVAKDSVPFTGMGDVLESGYNLGVDTGSFQESMIKNSSISLYKRLWQKILEHRPTNMTVSEHKTFNNNQLESGGYALITSAHNIEKYMAKRCDMVATKEKGFQSYMSFPLPKHSALAWLFDPEILSLVDRGLPRYWMDLSTPKRKRCATERQDRIQIEDLFLVFVITGICIVLGTVFLVVEHAIIRYHKGKGRT
ncbi:glutamate receptor ionotropic, kainate glr-3-like [Haliotis rubra]|uniref:glutamate receptor ionotropic, kainate glr-3-like n=1 Tax=Haliotis rubra TaxID=36100 RepID=UPI001EE61862|nr:glutamate receptor ionotropic, kainate glr-3-like [Haliotis rubra]